jgi:hypothetical protein
MSLEERATHDRLGRQTLSSRLPDAVSAQVLRRQTDELAMRVQPLRHRLQLTPDLVLGEEIE